MRQAAASVLSLQEILQNLSSSFLPLSSSFLCLIFHVKVDFSEGHNLLTTSSNTM